MITRRIWIRGHLATVSGYVEWGDPSTGSAQDVFIPTHVVFDDRPELAEHEELTDSELAAIDSAYWDGKPFDNYEHMTFSWMDTDRFDQEAKAACDAAFDHERGLEQWEDWHGGGGKVEIDWSNYEE
jgi:hypothetical protein